MSTQSIIQQVRWQDLKVRSEFDIVFELAKKEGWEDCEIFGYGNMITHPQELTGWKLIPADLYEDSIPAEGIGRIHRIINEGIRIQGVIIADDERKTETPPTPSRPKVLLSGVQKILSFFASTLAGLGRLSAELGRALAAGLGQLLAGLGRVLFRLISIAGVIALISLSVYLLIRFPLIMIIPGLMALAGTGTTTGTGVSYDPKLVILVDDGQGGTVWISVLTWYD